MARPALSEEERINRRASLLDAAQRLFHDCGTLPTVRDIAKAAGMAKGAVYLWFRTKEEIFVALLDANFGTLIRRLLPVIESLDPAPALAVGGFAAKYPRLLVEIPGILPLMSMHNSFFRENLPVEALSIFNRNLGAGFSAAGKLLERRIGSLRPGQGNDLLFRTWALTVGLWQMMELPEPLREILDDPAFSVLHRQFRTELEIAVTQLWKGAICSE